MSRVSQNADYSMAFSAWTNVQEDKKKNLNLIGSILFQV
jgi:hypothetical protein